MVKYFNENELTEITKQRKKTLIIYFAVLTVYLAISVYFLVYNLGLPYKNYLDTGKKLLKVKLIEYPLTFLFVVFSFIYLGIIFKRVNRYYKECVNLTTGLKETSEASFIGYNESIQNKDGVDMKSLVFLEWNKYKKDYYERKVLVFNEKPFPEIPESAMVKFVTQGNVLVEYEIQTEKC